LKKCILFVIALHIVTFYAAADDTVIYRREHANFLSCVQYAGDIIACGFTIEETSQPGEFIQRMNITSIDNQGGLNWEHNLSSSRYGKANSALKKIGVSGNYMYAVGYVESEDNENVRNLFLAQFDSAGKVLWQKEAKGPDLFSTPYDFIISESGDIYVGGHTASGYPVCADAFVQKFDPEGNTVWKKSFRLNSMFDDTVISIAETGPNTFLMGGVYESRNYGLEGFFRYFNEDGDMEKQFDTQDSDMDLVLYVFPAGGGDFISVGAYEGWDEDAGWPASFIRVSRYDSDNTIVWKKEVKTDMRDTTAGVYSEGIVFSDFQYGDGVQITQFHAMDLNGEIFANASITYTDYTLGKSFVLGSVAASKGERILAAGSFTSDYGRTSPGDSGIILMFPFNRHIELE
jgi:hypothetical protein